MEVPLTSLELLLILVVALFLGGVVNAFWGGLNVFPSAELPTFEEGANGRRFAHLRRVMSRPYLLLTTLLLAQLITIMLAGATIIALTAKAALALFPELTQRPLIFLAIELVVLIASAPLILLVMDFIPRTFLSSTRYVDRLSPVILLLSRLSILPAWAIRRLGGLVREEEILRLYHAEHLDLFRELDRRLEQEVLEAQEKEMIANIFDFRERNVRDVMTPRIDVMAIDVNIEPRALLTILASAPYSRFPVFEGTIDNVVGVLHIRDLLKPIREGRLDKLDLRSLLREPVFVPETKPLDELLREMQQRRTHMAIVLDEYGGTAGIVTIEDILEEIVGEIQDEYDKEALPVYQTEEGEFLVDARLPLEDLAKILGIELEESEEYETLGGLVMDLLGHIPEPGESVMVDGYELEVVSVDKHRIKRIRIKRIKPAAAKEG